MAPAVLSIGCPACGQSIPFMPRIKQDGTGVLLDTIDVELHLTEFCPARAEEDLP